MDVIFDLDGTLVDSLQGIHTALNGALARGDYGSTSLEETTEFIGQGSWMLCRQAVEFLRADYEGDFPELADALNADFMTLYQEAWQDGTVILEGVLPMLAELGQEGYRLSVLSNKPDVFTKEIVTGLFPAGTFAVALGQREGVEKKPDPSGVREILANSDAADTRAVLVGDSVVDVETAHNAGIPCVALVGGYEDEEALLGAHPEAVIQTMSEVTGTLERLTFKDRL